MSYEVGIVHRDKVENVKIPCICTPLHLIRVSEKSVRLETVVVDMIGLVLSGRVSQVTLQGELTLPGGRDIKLQY